MKIGLFSGKELYLDSDIFEFNCWIPFPKYVWSSPVTGSTTEGVLTEMGGSHLSITFFRLYDKNTYLFYVLKIIFSCLWLSFSLLVAIPCKFTLLMTVTIEINLLYLPMVFLHLGKKKSFLWLNAYSTHWAMKCMSWVFLGNVSIWKCVWSG